MHIINWNSHVSQTAQPFHPNFRLDTKSQRKSERSISENLRKYMDVILIFWKRSVHNLKQNIRERKFYYKQNMQYGKFI